MTTPALRAHRILSLGAGVQSTALYLMFLRGELTPQIDCAIFADVGDEPRAVYDHLAWLRSLNGPPIEVRSAGCLGDDLLRGQNSTDQRFTSIPAFTAGDTVGQTRRQCSAEYKIAVIERFIRREVCGLKPRGRFPKGTVVHQYLGISLDEAGRAARIAANMGVNAKWSTPHFPLVEKFWTRADCLNYLVDKVPHQTPRSACVYCPYHSDAEWFALKHGDPAGWARAVEIDTALRVPGRIINRGMNAKLYLHRSCQPLALVQLDTRPTARDLQMSMSFREECMGVCGN